ncbi:hypothetical protein FOA52_015906 [Chlamydomonas sp. UWO 241]|nr:hypothetical protein FOA52_015906 [Chlamydomonas sp. UWO 241]
MAPPPSKFRATLGKAAAHKEAIVSLAVFLVAYAVANPSYLPHFLAVYANPLNAAVHGLFGAIFGGWWPLVVAKLALLAAACYGASLVVRLVREQQEAQAAVREAVRVRRAREESQARLAKEATEYARVEAERVAAEGAAAEADRVIAAALRHADQASKVGADTAARAGAQARLASAIDADARAIPVPTRAAGAGAPQPRVGADAAARESAQARLSSAREADACAVAAPARASASGAPQPPRADAGEGNLGGRAQWLARIQAQADEQAAARSEGLLAAAAVLGAGVPAGGGASGVSSASGGRGLGIPASGSSSSLAAAARAPGDMVPLDAAREAAQRQEQYLRQLDDELNAPARALEAARQADRLLREEQDAEFQAAALEDAALAREREAKIAAAAAEAEAREHAQAEAGEVQASLRAVREAVRASLPAEPSAVGAGGAVLVRVRLPGGGSQLRRFAPDATVADVTQWVSVLDEMPLSPPGPWRLVTNFPKSAPEPGSTVRELAAGVSAVALFVDGLTADTPAGPQL